MKIKKFYILFLAVTFIFYLFIDFNFLNNSRPIPTEFINKKNKRNQLKKDRKAWIENMHKSHPDDNWREIDRINRKKNSDNNLSIRSNIINSQNKNVLNQIYKVQVSRNLQGEWFEKGSNNLAGRIRTADIDFDNNNIYCASSGGNIWKGTLQGDNWQSLNDYKQILGISFLRLVNQRILIGSENNGFFYSDNDGMTLVEANGLSNASIKRYIIQSETNHIYALVNTNPRSIYISTDLGENFELLLNLNSSQGVTSSGISHFDIFTPRYFYDDIYLLKDMSFYKIQDGNLVLISNIPGEYLNDVLLTGGNGSNGTFFYAYVQGRIFKSINSGNSWFDLGESPSDWWWINGFNSSNIERDKIFIGGMEAYRNLDGDNQWEIINPWWEYYDNIQEKLHADIPEIRFFLDNEYNEVALISTDGGLYFSDDYIQSVQNISLSGLGVSQYYSTFSQRFYPYAIFAGSQDQGLQKSITNNNYQIENFNQIISGDYGHLVSGDDGNSIWTNYPGFTIYYPEIISSNSSLSLDFPGSGYLWLPPLMEHPYNASKVFLGGGGTDGGNHIIELGVLGNQVQYNQLDYNFSDKISAMEYSPIDPSHMYVLTEDGDFYYSSDFGENWVQTMFFSGPNSHYFYGSTIWASQTELGKLYIGGSGYSNPAVYISTNHGQTFEIMDQGLPNTLVFQISGTPDDLILFAATEVGPYAFSDNQGQWSLISGIHAPDQTYWSVDYIPEIRTARFGTYGRGIWDFVLEDNYQYYLGDVNQDSNINIQDIILVITFILGSNSPTDEEFIISDLNSDEEINVLDIVMILDIIFDN